MENNNGLNKIAYRPKNLLIADATILALSPTQNTHTFTQTIKIGLQNSNWQSAITSAQILITR